MQRDVLIFEKFIKEGIVFHNVRCSLVFLEGGGSNYTMGIMNVLFLRKEKKIFELFGMQCNLLNHPSVSPNFITTQKVIVKSHCCKHRKLYTVVGKFLHNLDFLRKIKP